MRIALLHLVRSRSPEGRYEAQDKPSRRSQQKPRQPALCARFGHFSRHFRVEPIHAPSAALFAAPTDFPLEPVAAAPANAHGPFVAALVRLVADVDGDGRPMDAPRRPNRRLEASFAA
jgi:hypothetical protein